MIIYYHTSALHQPRFEAITKSIDSEIEIYHHVNEGILEQAMQKGVIDDSLQQQFKNEIAFLKTKKPKAIICTCSTFGAVVDSLEKKEFPIYRIDQPMMQEAIRLGRKILVAYTAPSTKKVTFQLLEEEAKKAEKDIKIIEGNCTEAWQFFEQKEMIAYHTSILEHLKPFESQVEVIILAQASMEGTKTLWFNCKIPILTSAKIGVQSILAMI